MSIDKINLNLLCLALPISIESAMKAIDKNGLGIIYLTNEAGQLIGALSDGDIRRALISGVKLTHLVELESEIYNQSPKYLMIDCGISEFWRLSEMGFDTIPLVTEDLVIVDYATRNHFKKFPVLEPKIGVEEINNVLDCLTTGWISSQGKYIGQFEREFSAYVGSGHAVAVSNGTVALQLALTTFGIGPGDEVLVPNFTFAASINSIIHAGASPVIVDVDSESWSINIKEIKKLINKRTKAIMPVHLYGQPAQLDEIYEIASANGLYVVEDCAEALGALYKGRKIGDGAHCACFSFFANKMITTGEGGMLLFSNPDDALKAKVLRDHGMSPDKKYWHTLVGYNFRMTNMQAAIGVAQLEKISTFMQQRKFIFSEYYKNFELRKNISRAIQFLPKNNWSENSNWLFTIVLLDKNASFRDEMLRRLTLRGIDARPGFYCLSDMPPYKNYSKGEYLVSKKISQSSLCLPSSPGLTSDDISYISDIFFSEYEKLNND